MRRIIITGAQGFIGRNLSSRLMQEGFDLIMLDFNNKCDIRGNNIITTNLTDEYSVKQSAVNIGSADVLVHLAADITVPGSINTIKNNIGSMYGALELAKKTFVKYFVLLSSIPVVGDIIYTPIDENHPVLPKTPYHLSKYLCELLLETYSSMFDAAAVLRISSPIGIGMRKGNFLSYVLGQLRDNKDVELFGNGSRVQNYIDVRDVANALINVIKEFPNGLFILGGRRSYSNIELVSLCKDIVSSDASIIMGCHADPEENERWIINFDKAKHEFNYSPLYSLEDSIKWILEN